jgi:hypothetical protein
MIIRIGLFTLTLLVAVASLSQPAIIQQPANQSVSVGANATFRVGARGTPPLACQWRFNGREIPNATQLSLSFNHVQLTNAGSYDVVITDSSGSSKSGLAKLTVDPTFTKITDGAIVNDGGISWACAWGDYDNDGFLDLFVSNGTHDVGQRNFLYHNNRDGTFTKIISGPIVNDMALFRGAVWVDFDNDGNLDLSVVSHGTRNFLYRNNGDGTFARVATGIIANDLVVESIGGSWVDYDRDGFVDFFVANAGGAKNSLYHNNGDGTFSKFDPSFAIVNDIGDSLSCAWADFTNSGWPGLLVSNRQGSRNFLYGNIGGIYFPRLVSSVIESTINSSWDSVGSAWGDYDNDGFLDLFVANGSSTGGDAKNFLYHNNGGDGPWPSGDGEFTKVTSGPIVEDPVRSPAGAWGDYDNDGYLDLFVLNVDRKNLLYHNNGDGTFARVTEGSLVNDGGPGVNSSGCSWGDYDNDGFLDLFVANGGGPATSPVNNFLYRNNGNSNAWLKVRCVGAVSNRSAIGTKVRVKATIRGKTLWQLREVSVGDGFQSGNPLETHFGLGDATNIDTLRIEWPSGTVQELRNLATRQILTVIEPARLLAGMTNGLAQFALKGARGFQYDISASTNLTAWFSVRTVIITNSTGIAQVMDTNAPGSDRIFYRAVMQ